MHFHFQTHHPGGHKSTPKQISPWNIPNRIGGLKSFLLALRATCILRSKLFSSSGYVWAICATSEGHCFFVVFFTKKTFTQRTLQNDQHPRTSTLGHLQESVPHIKSDPCRISPWHIPRRRDGFGIAHLAAIAIFLRTRLQWLQASLEHGLTKKNTRVACHLHAIGSRKTKRYNKWNSWFTNQDPPDATHKMNTVNTKSHLQMAWCPEQSLYNDTARSASFKQSIQKNTGFGKQQVEATAMAKPLSPLVLRILPEDPQFHGKNLRGSMVYLLNCDRLCSHHFLKCPSRIKVNTSTANSNCFPAQWSLVFCKPGPSDMIKDEESVLTLRRFVSNSESLSGSSGCFCSQPGGSSNTLTGCRLAYDLPFCGLAMAR